MTSKKPPQGESLFDYLSALSGQAPQAQPSEVRRPARAALRDIDANTVMMGPNMPELSVRAANKAMGRAGTMRRLVFEFIKEQGVHGATSDEVERGLHRPHQTISATINSLWNDLLITRVLHRTRLTQWGNDAQVYVCSEQGLDAWKRLGA